MSESKYWQTLNNPKGQTLVIEQMTGEVIAKDVKVEEAEYIVGLHNRELKFQSKLKEPIRNATPFVVETLQRDGSCPRYRVSRHRGGGVYSDEFLDIKEAEFMRHMLEREEADKEQLRYRIWQLEQALNAAKEAMIATRLHITHHPMCAAESEFNKDCDCRRGVLNLAIKKLEEL